MRESAIPSSYSFLSGNKWRCIFHYDDNWTKIKIVLISICAYQRRADGQHCKSGEGTEMCWKLNESLFQKTREFKKCRVCTYLSVEWACTCCCNVNMWIWLRNDTTSVSAHAAQKFLPTEFTIVSEDYLLWLSGREWGADVSRLSRSFRH